MIRIKVLHQGAVIAESSHPEEALLCFDHPWEEGDLILLETDSRYLCWRLDSVFSDCRVYVPDGRMSWAVPFGEHRTAYAPGAFEGSRHVLVVRRADGLPAGTDLACNPSDLRGSTDFYPHCTANVETRNESVFAARNVIDGLRFNNSHGVWPYESWGIGAREDAWCKIDFGREVRVDRMALTLRADFPHDAYWVSGHVTASDGTDLEFPLEKTAERQWIDLGGRKVSWLRLERMCKSDDPSAFPSLRAWEVLGIG